ncbi:hypothetical protein [Streptomyces sp. NPDC127112]
MSHDFQEPECAASPLPLSTTPLVAVQGVALPVALVVSLAVTVTL